MVTVSDIARIVGGEVVGDGGTRVTGMAAAWAAKEGDITFAYDAAGIKEALESRASCILTTEDADASCKKTVLKVKDMKRAMTILYNAMLEMTPPAKGETHATAVIAKSARIGKNFTCGAHAVIGEHAVIGDNVVIGANSVVGDDVKIGDLSRLYPNVTVYNNNDLGKNVIIHSGSVIGADGFGYVPQGEKIYKVPQMGKVVIEDNVEIGANSCIDRGTFTVTVIGRDTKIDNLVQIAHNVTIGKRVLLAAQVGIAGSATVGDGTMMGGQVGVADHAEIGTNVKVGGATGITRHVGDNEVVFGYPHRPAKEARKWHGLQSMLIKHERNLRKFLKELSDKYPHEGQK